MLESVSATFHLPGRPRIDNLVTRDAERESPAYRRHRMENRLVITTLCVAAFAYACGPWIHSQNTATPAPAAGAAGAAVGAVAGAGAGIQRPLSRAERGKVVTTLDVVPSGNRVDLALRVTNNTARTVELRFPSGRTHDFAVLDSRGGIVWRWSTGRIFTQTMQSRTLKSRDSVTLEDSWDASGAHGSYTAVALLATETHPVERRLEFTLP